MRKRGCHWSKQALIHGILAISLSLAITAQPTAANPAASATPAKDKKDNAHNAPATQTPTPSLAPPEHAAGHSVSCASAEYATRTKEAGTSAETGPAVVTGSAPMNTTQQFQIGKQVTVCIMGLDEWTSTQKKSPSTLQLVMGGVPFEGIAPEISPAGQEYLNFPLRLETQTQVEAWAQVVDAARHSPNDQVPITVGPKNEPVFRSFAVVTIPPYPRSWIWFLPAFLVLLAGLIWLAVRTDLLRYSAGKHPSYPLRSPFSMGMVQMAVWFYLVVTAYVYILLSTQQYLIPMGSVLGLLGISSTTGLAAVFVDKKKEADEQNHRTSLLSEQAALKAGIDDLSKTGMPPNSAAEAELLRKKSRLAEVEAALAQLPAEAPAAVSKGFFADVLDDGDGVSFHRFQIAIWTIVLGCVFAWAVYRNMSMPEFDPSLLTLMGISSGTYVGFKFPEKPK
jgi:hypothetical protein